MKIQKTNAMRMLDKAKINYEIKEYVFDEKEFSGEKVALDTGLDPASVFKTILLRTDKKEIIVCCMPVNKEINLKKLAASAGVKRAEPIHVNEISAVSGYVRGGCSPIGMKRKYKTFIEKSACEHENIAVSAGARGMQMIVNTRQLIEYVGAVLYNNEG